MSVKLLQPVILQQHLDKQQYNLLPEDIRFMANNYPYVTKVTITPQKAPGSGRCRVLIVSPANSRTGGMSLENGGRVPVTAPVISQDDLRPIVYYAFGKGTQKFQVVLSSDHTNYVDAAFTVE
jgi:hypothetical protein